MACGGAGEDGGGANPLFHPDAFSNFLCRHALSQIHAPNLSTIQPLSQPLPPPLTLPSLPTRPLPPLFSVVLAEGVKVKV